jgi:hypothetical protein
MSISLLWPRLEAAVASCGGRIVPLGADSTIPLYDSPSDPKRAAALAPPAALVIARQPPGYVELIAAHGYCAVDVPNRRRSFVFLTPPACAQMTSATGEPDRRWADVVTERLAGRSSFGWILFAAWEFADVNGWALAADGQVWAVEDSLPFEEVGSFETWLAERIADIEADGADGDEEEGDADEGDEGSDDEGDTRPSILDDL